MKIKSITLVRLCRVLIGISVLSACAVRQNNLAEHAHISVHIQDQDRIRFAGKGAGAGMMMSASMGSMGIAIGVAIDEGIAKEIHESYISSGYDFPTIVKAETDAWLAKVCVEKTRDDRLCSTNTELNIRIYHYGFVTAQGDGDPVKAELDIGFALGDRAERRLHSKDADTPFQTDQLDVIKTDGDRSSALLKDGYQRFLILYETQVLSSLPE